MAPDHHGALFYRKRYFGTPDNTWTGTSKNEEGYDALPQGVIEHNRSQGWNEDQP